MQFVQGARRCAALLPVLLIACIMTSTARAGTWTEVSDAGESIATVQSTNGTGALTTITGTLTPGGLPDYDVDIYCINIITPSNFSATLSVGTGTERSPLFLFEPSPPGNRGVVAQEGFYASSPTLITAGTFVLNPGLYYLAIGMHDVYAMDAWSNLLWANQLNGSPSFGIPSAPSNANPLSQWMRLGGGFGGGPYTITLAGTEFGNCELPLLCDTCDTAIKVDSTRYGRWDYFNTSDGSEPAVPLGGLATAYPNPRPFDDLSCNNYFAHTMLFPANTGCQFIGAYLRLHLKSCGSTLDNDALYLLQNGTVLWGVPVASLAPGGHWNGQDSITVVLDLCNLPPAPGYGTNLLPYLNTPYSTGQGSLDVYIQDDTGVDYMEITTYRCCYGEIPGKKYNDLNHNGVYEPPGEPLLNGWTINVSGFAPGYGPVSVSTTTPSSNFFNENYRFTGLPGSGPSGYTVTETNQPGWVNTGSAAISVFIPNGGSSNYVDFGNAQCLQPPDSMTAWWPLDESSGATALEVIAGVNGSYGSAGHAAGMVSGAVQITSASQVVTVSPGSNPNLNFGTGSFSIDAWVRTLDAATSVRTILDKRQASPLIGYALSISFGRLVFQLADDGISPGFTNYAQAAAGNLTNGAWHHVAVTVDRATGVGGVGTLYVDGGVVHMFTPNTTTGSEIGRPGSVTNSGNLTIGQAFDGSSINFNGFIDEVELFSRALDSLEVVAMWAADSVGKCKPPRTVSVRDEPESGSLSRAVGFPNPFENSTGVRFSLEKETDVDVRVFDVAGRELRALRSGHFGAGRHYVPWDGLDADGVRAKVGIYFIRVQSDERVLNTKVVRVK